MRVRQQADGPSCKIEVKEQPTAEETAAQIKNLSDLAAYSGTLKRVVKVLSVLTNRPI